MDASTVIVPPTVRANTSKLGQWRSETSHTISKYTHPVSNSSSSESSESENDSEVFTSEEDKLTDLESELETDHEESPPRQGPRPLGLKPLGISGDVFDVVFEFRLESLVSQWTAKELNEHRKVIRLGRDDADGAVSLWQASSSGPAALSISCLEDSDNRNYLLTLHDLQRILAFISGVPLTDPVKKRLHKLLDANGWRELKQPESALSRSVSQLNSPPCPVLRRTSQLWVLAWDQLEAILDKIFASDQTCVTFLS